MRRLFIILPIVFHFTVVAFSQCSGPNTTFREGEVANYQIYYNWGFIWLNAGWVEFKVKPSIYLGREVYHLDSRGETHENYDWLFKVRDRYQSFLDKETFLPLWFYRQNYEGGFEVENQYFFFHEQNKAFAKTQNSEKPYSEDTIDIKPCTYDLLSMVYYTRNLDVSHAKPGDKFPINCIIDTKVYELYARYLGEETITDRDGKSFNCLKFSALLVEGTIFKGGEDMHIWVTNDGNKIPILVEAKILIGAVKAYFTGAEGVRYPNEKLTKTP